MLLFVNSTALGLLQLQCGSGQRLWRASAYRAPHRAFWARRIRVLVDMDGVLCDFDRSINENIIRLHPGSPIIPLAERTEFYASKHYTRLHGEEAGERVNAVIKSRGFIENLPEIAGCVEAVKAIDALPNVEVFFCTSPLGYYEQVRGWWRCGARASAQGPRAERRPCTLLVRCGSLSQVRAA